MRDVDGHDGDARLVAQLHHHAADAFIDVELNQALDAARQHGLHILHRLGAVQFVVGADDVHTVRLAAFDDIIAHPDIDRVDFRNVAEADRVGLLPILLLSPCQRLDSVVRALKDQRLFLGADRDRQQQRQQQCQQHRQFLHSFLLLRFILSARMADRFFARPFRDGRIPGAASAAGHPRHR